ncbi:19465_t:CDS:2 [Gigaspora margarita]|uniref:19465_t:CDS:1 n=1 Tax=Gigaspora margarita TaxID=4874 RepID=A0ABN7V4Z2_GIGMA|nr:19465_t:CDS:2 [Gigaspora margarita]
MTIRDSEDNKLQSKIQQLIQELKVLNKKARRNKLNKKQNYNIKANSGVSRNYHPECLEIKKEKAQFICHIEHNNKDVNKDEKIKQLVQRIAELEQEKEGWNKAKNNFINREKELEEKNKEPEEKPPQFTNIEGILDLTEYPNLRNLRLSLKCSV